jgi:hypothetical protein
VRPDHPLMPVMCGRVNDVLANFSGKLGPIFAPFGWVFTIKGCDLFRDHWVSCEESAGLVLVELYTYDIPLTVTAFEAGLRRL